MYTRFCVDNHGVLQSLVYLNGPRTDGEVQDRHVAGRSRRRRRSFRLDKLQRALRDIYTVHTTTSGVEAIHLIKALPEVNVLVVNEDLPRMKGTELLRFLNEIFKNSDAIIKILLTACPSNGTTIDLASYGRIDCCLAKPEDPAAIRRKISFLIAQRSREKRSSMRVTLDGTRDIRIETGPLGEAKLVNLIENGMFLKTLSALPEGSAMPVEHHPPRRPGLYAQRPRRPPGPGPGRRGRRLRVARRREPPLDPPVHVGLRGHPGSR